MAAQPSAFHDHQVAAEDGNPTYMDAHLYTAAAKGQVNILTEHQHQDDLLRQLTPQRNTLLHIASQFAQLSSVQFILQLPSSSLLQQPNQKGDTALHLAAREGHCEVVRALIHAANALRPESGLEMMRMLNRNRGTALHEAVWYNHLQVVEFLVQEDPEFIYGADSSGYSPLYMAAERGYEELVEMIIEKCNSPPHSGILGRTALHAAVIRGHLEMTKRILEWKPILAKEVDEEGWSPLHCAAYLKNAAIAEELLNNWPDKSVIYLGIKNRKRTALHIATLVGSIEIVELLLSHAPDCSEQVDAGGHNVFHFAMMKKKRDHQMGGKLVKIDGLRVRGLVNQKDDNGDTPLHLLASLGVNDKQFIMDEIVDKKARDNKHLYAKEKIVSEVFFSLKTLDVFGKEVGVEFRPHESLPQPVMDDKDKKDATAAGGDKKEVNPQKKDGEDMREAASSHLVVAALVATVTFAAGFTVPGGYGGENGMAVLSEKASFKAFVVSDVIAFILSVSAIFCYFLKATSYAFGSRTHDGLFSCGCLFTLYGIAAMLVAFMTGLYAVLPFSFGLPILTSCLLVSLYTYLQITTIFRQTEHRFNLIVKYYKASNMQFEMMQRESQPNFEMMRLAWQRIWSHS